MQGKNESNHAARPRTQVGRKQERDEVTSLRPSLHPPSPRLNNEAKYERVELPNHNSRRKEGREGGREERRDPNWS